MFVTNNSTKSRAGYLSKFTGLGLNVKAEEIYSSSYAAAAYLASIDFKKKVYVVGEVGIQEELDLKARAGGTAGHVALEFWGEGVAALFCSLRCAVGAVIAFSHLTAARRNLTRLRPPSTPPKPLAHTPAGHQAHRRPR